MIQISILCCHCESDQLIKNGHAENGKQRYRCQACGRQSRENPHDRGLSPDRQAEIIRAYQERPSMRGIARIFGISRNTLADLVKKNPPSSPL